MPPCPIIPLLTLLALLALPLATPSTPSTPTHPPNPAAALFRLSRVRTISASASPRSIRFAKAASIAIHGISTAEREEDLPEPTGTAAQCCDDGFTGDFCLFDFECRGDRQCFDISDSNLGLPCSSSESGSCICIPLVFVECFDSTDCEQGELCTSLDGSVRNVCISAEVVENGGFQTDEGSEDTLPPDDGPSGTQVCCNDGFTFDNCESSADCRGDRDCREDGTSFIIPCTSSSFVPCVCQPLRPVVCSDSSVCEAGEVCSFIPSTTVTVCVSEDVVENVDGFVPADSGPPTTFPECCNNGFTFDSCTSFADCRGVRDCLNFDDGEPVPCSDSSPSNVCLCVPPEFTSCTISFQCEPGEVCASFEDFDPICVSEGVVENIDEFDEVEPVIAVAPTDEPADDLSASAAPTEELSTSAAPTEELSTSPAPTEELSTSPAPTEDPLGNVAPPNAPLAEDTASPICIDATALAHLPRESLVFREHSIARVLCDKAGSCATRGHMVVFRGQAMMMGTYCEMVNCDKRQMHVNSPRYRKGTRVKSWTEGLEFTAFAARWETRVEEAVLVAAVRAGL